jgi:uncharacterized protein YecE (DUF72 family)
VRIGIAGWSIPSAYKDVAGGSGTHLARYAAVFDAVEINSSFYRPHRRATYQRWSDSVPPEFRFSVKMPKSVTHECGLVDAQDELHRFIDEIGGLGDRLGAILVQLPATLEFAPRQADAFFEMLRGMSDAAVVCEPRHASWFGANAARLLERWQIGRVAADPARLAAAAEPAGRGRAIYFRLHGSPRMYYSAYDAGFLEKLAARAARESRDNAAAQVWCIFDNTAEFAAWGNALELKRMTAAPAAGGRDIKT